jgi:hypothetical protein
VTGQVLVVARDAYNRDLCLTHRIQYVHTYLLAKIWHIAQVSLSRKKSATTGKDHSMVYLEGSDPAVPSVNPATPDGKRRPGPDRHCCQMPYTLSNQVVSSGGKRGDAEAWFSICDLRAPRGNPQIYKRYHKNSSTYESMRSNGRI